MTEIDIPFRPEMVAQTIRGRKICTSRYKKYGDAGDILPVGGKRYEILGVIRPRLEAVQDHLFVAEGFDSTMEFEELWVEMHQKRGFRPNDRVYTHFFEEAQ